MSVTREPEAQRWDERYADREYLWDLAPNLFVKRHLAAAPVGTAIDLGAGEGRNAVWLAQQGWQVTAVDFSPVGLKKAAQLANDRDVSERIEIVVADATTYQPEEPVDLVVLAYLQLPAEPRRAALQHAATWLRPGGRMLVVAHDRANTDHGYGGPPDPGVCYDLDETVEALGALTIDVAKVAERIVDTDDGPRTALDTLVIATLPSG